MKLNIHRSIRGWKRVRDEGLQRTADHYGFDIVGVGAEVAECEHGVLSSLDVLVLAVSRQSLKALQHYNFVVFPADAQVGYDEKAVADGLVIVSGLGVQGVPCLGHDGL